MVLTALASAPASAQALPGGTSPPERTAPGSPRKPARSDEITVTGKAPAAQSAIDRKTYRIASDLQADAGSASDVLRDLPSVEVDAQGAVSLRGDADVQVLIDGKPSTTMSATNRADALEQLPANTIDRIEIITSPAARYKPDGSGGIINIITRVDHKTGTTGSLSASGGSDGRFNLAGNLTYRSGALTAAASATLHRDMRWRPFSDSRTDFDAATGAAVYSTQDSLFHGEKLSRIFTASLDYDLTGRDRLSASGTYNHRTGSPQIAQHNRVFGAGAAPTSDFTRTGSGDEHELSDEAAFTYAHDFGGKDHAFTLELRRGETIESETRRFTDIFREPPGQVTIDQQRPRTDQLQRELTAEYAVPISRGKLLLGYDLQRDDDDFLNRGELIDPLTRVAVTDPAYTDHFGYQQTVHAGYATYDRPLGKRLSAILGARFEQTIIHTREFDLGVLNRQGYFAAYPTLHLQYALSPAQTLKASYSKRVVRPDPDDLNPFPEFSDPLNLRAGNPLLKPEETQAFEAGYQYDAHHLSIEATLFLRRTRNAFTMVGRLIGPAVLLTTRENLGHSAATGLDLSASRKLSRLLSARLSGTIARNSIDPGNLGVGRAGAIVSATAKGGLDFRLTRRDLLQVSANYSGKRLIPQGYRLPSANANLGYRHQCANGLTAVLWLSDIFDTQRERSMIDGAAFTDTSTRRNTRRTLTVALTLPIGTGRSSGAAPFEFGD